MMCASGIVMCMEDDIQSVTILRTITRQNIQKDTYWALDENGYVSIIANAGFYKEKEAKKIVRLSSGNAEMILVTREILDKAKCRKLGDWHAAFQFRLRFFL